MDIRGKLQRFLTKKKKMSTDKAGIGRALQDICLASVGCDDARRRWVFTLW